MSFQRDIEELLTTAGVEVNDDLMGTAVGDGICWVLLGDFEVGGDVGQTATVVAAVVPGGDLGTLLTRVWEAFKTQYAIVPVAYETEYESVPPPNRKGAIPCDFATVTVNGPLL